MVEIEKKPDKKQAFQSASYPAVATLNNSPSELRGLLHGILGMSTGEKKIRNKR